MKNQLKHLIHEAKLLYIKQLILQSKKDPQSVGKLWRGVNGIIGQYQTRSTVLDTTISLDSVNDFLEELQQLMMIIVQHPPIFLQMYNLRMLDFVFQLSLLLLFMSCCLL